MRVSTEQFHSQGYNAIARHQEAVLDLQEKMSSGYRVNKPGDDPVAVNQIHALNKSLNTIEQFEKNGDYAKSQLSMAETQVETVIESTQRARELAIQMSNGTYNDTDKKATAAEIGQIIKQVESVLNSSNSEEELLFAGSSVKENKAFIEDPNTPGYYAYIGSDNSTLAATPLNEQAKFGSRFVQIGFDDDNEVAPNDQGDASRVRITDNGDEVFRTGTGNLNVDTNGDGANDAQVDNNILNVLVQFKKDLESGKSGFDGLVDRMDEGIKSMTDAQAQIGGRMNRIDSQREAGAVFSMSLQERRSKLEDMDLVQGITDLTQRQNALQMAQQVFSRVQQNNLFDYLR